ncbi:MAG: type II secretion system protein N, partial [Acidiferrobacterales bacterium]
AQLISALYSPAALFSPAGRIQFNAKQFMVDSKNVSGGAVIQWHQAVSSLSSVRPLGDYRLSFDGHGQSAALRLETLSGDLAVSGQGAWQLNSGQVQFSGFAKAAAHSAELEPLLRLFGPDSGGGQRKLTLNSNLRFP